MLKPMVEELINKGVAEESDGAIVITIPKVNNKKNTVPLMIRKSDGGSMYGTTDLAAINYRVNTIKADRIVYVTDDGQKLHFQLVFAAGEKAGYVDPKLTELNHVPFGLIQQLDPVTKKPTKMKSRSGDTVKLVELLDEAKERALQVFKERKELEGSKVQVDEAELESTAEIMGISAIKYYDMKRDLIQNYIFDWDDMLDT